MIVDVSALSRKRLEALCLHLNRAGELTRVINNTLLDRLIERDLMNEAVADTVNEWSAAINELVAASGTEVARIAGKRANRDAPTKSTQFQ